jgi:hypothetical protein
VARNANLCCDLLGGGERSLFFFLSFFLSFFFFEKKKKLYRIQEDGTKVKGSGVYCMLISVPLRKSRVPVG